MRETARFVVTGRVQGVGFRAWACAEGRRLGLDGWVRNRPDGSVEAAAAGAPDALAVFAARLREGPPPAKPVEARRMADAPEIASGSGFGLRR
jgi:acylphosphatase